MQRVLGAMTMVCIGAATVFSAEVNRHVVAAIDEAVEAIASHSSGQLKRYTYNVVIDFDTAGDDIIGEPGRPNPNMHGAGEGSPTW